MPRLVQARRPACWHLRGGSRARDRAAARLYLRANGPEPGDRVWGHGGIEATPPCPPRFAPGGRTVSTSAVVHVLVSGLATGSIYALMALSLVIAFWSMGGSRQIANAPPSSSQAAGLLAPPRWFTCS